MCNMYIEFRFTLTRSLMSPTYIYICIYIFIYILDFYPEKLQVFFLTCFDPLFIYLF